MTRPRVPDTSTQTVVELLTTILEEFKKQVQSKTPEPLEGEAVRAVEHFREISAALALQQRPTMTLTVAPGSLGPSGGSVTLTWSSTDAQTVSIDQKVGDVTTSLGEVTPAAGGVKVIVVAATTTFTATAKGLCASDTKIVEVTVSSIG